MKESKAGETEVERKVERKMGRHRRRSEREQMIEAYHASGLTQAAFANERGLKITTLRA